MWRLLAASLLLFLGCGTHTVATGAGQGAVEAVVDGDTVDVAVGRRHERVRLIGIDTPEVYVDTGTPECYGPEASAFTKHLLAPGTKVRLERDVVGRDDYGRLLAYLYVQSGGGGGEVMVNEELVRRGLATPLSIAPNVTYAARFAADARAAEAAGLGLWEACAG